jgi:hypothetical protein
MSTQVLFRSTPEYTRLWEARVSLALYDFLEWVNEDDLRFENNSPGNKSRHE